MLSLFTEVTIDGFALWVVLLLCLGVFLASFMDAIAGGGGIISCPAHLIAFGSLPAPYALGTNKVSAAIGTVFSTARFIKNGYVNWKLFAPSIAFALTGSVIGTWLQHRTPDAILKYMLLIVLPVVAVITLRNRDWPDEPGEIDFKKQAAIVSRRRRRENYQPLQQYREPCDPIDQRIRIPPGRPHRGGVLHCGALYWSGSRHQKREQDCPPRRHCRADPADTESGQ